MSSGDTRLNKETWVRTKRFWNLLKNTDRKASIGQQRTATIIRCISYGVISVLLGAVLIQLIVKNLSGIGSLVLAQFCIALLICVFLFQIELRVFTNIKNDEKSWPERNQGFLTFLGLFLTLIIFLIGEASMQLKELKITNGEYPRNQSYLLGQNLSTSNSLKEMLQDIERDELVYYVSQFPIEGYEGLKAHVGLYYTGLCRSNFYSLVNRLDLINKINEIKGDLGPSNSQVPHLAKLLKENIKETEEILQLFQSNCIASPPDSVPSWY